MRYMVVTTKHHEGFALWDSALSDYTVAHTPFGKDLIGPLVTAFRARGLGVGFYHSLIDWHHPDFPVDGLHPRRGDQPFIGAGPSAFSPPADCRYTQRGNRLYLHVFAWPFGHLHLPGLAGQVRYAQFLHDASQVRRHAADPGQPVQTTTPDGQPPGTLTLQLPVQRPDVAVPVIELFLVQ